MKNRVFTIISTLSLLMTSCQTPSPVATERSCGDQRDPASVGLQCSALFGEAKNLTPEKMSPEEPIYMETISDQLTWDKWIESDVDFLRFYSRNSLEKGKAAGKHGTDVWGFENYKSYVAARDLLNNIRPGKLNIDRSLIMKVHELGSEGIKKEAWLMGKIMPKNMSVGNSSGFKVRQNVGGDPIVHPLNESQYQALKANKWITKFLELPWPLSRPNVRRGWIVYGDYKNIERSISDLSEWYFKNKNSMDPIDLAAEFQYRFVSLHPFIDGNGRTSMLLANRILREGGLPGVMNTFPGYDIYYDLPTWKQVFRQSVNDYIDMVKKVEIGDNTVPSINNANQDGAPRTALLPKRAFNMKMDDKRADLDFQLKKKFDFINDSIGSSNSFIPIGSGVYTMLTDGFFYNPSGIPHMIYEGKLYPIADKTYLLYAEGGDLNPHTFTRRSLTLAHRNIFRDHIQYVANLRSGKIKAKDIEIVSYTKISDANAKGEIYLYPWQLDVFENAISIKDTDPAAILAPTRGYQTNYELAFNFNRPISISDVVAQYQFMEMKYYTYEKYARSIGNTSLLNIIRGSRERYFNAAKQLLAQSEEIKQTVPPSYQMIIKSAPRYTFLQKYISYTNLAYPTLKAAIDARGDQQIVVMRSDMAITQKIGFISNQTYIDLAKKLPGYDSFKAWIAQADKNSSDDKLPRSALEQKLRKEIPGFDNLANRINMALSDNRYDRRGVADAFAREFVDHYTHALDSPLKDHISLSTSTDLYFDYIGDGTSADIPFLAKGLGGGIYFLKLDKKNLAPTIATPYSGEFELLSQKNISPFKIIDKLEVDHFTTRDENKFNVTNNVLDQVFYVSSPEQ